MSRNLELESILQAQYDWEGAWPQQKAAYFKIYDRLVKHHVRKYNATAAARRLPQITESEFREALGDRYREFKSRRDREMRQRLHRLKS